jgi:hypothetical protein
VLRGGGVQLIHNIHDGSTDDLDADRGELWALTGAGGTAATMVIDQMGAYTSQTGIAIVWDTLRTWISETDLAAFDTMVPAAQKPHANKKKTRDDASSVTSTRSSRRRRRGISTKADYRRILELSEEDDDDDADAADDREDDSDNNDDVIFQASVTLPNMIPLPGFLVAALMQVYTTDPSKLCIAAISAINARATTAGVDPELSTLAQGAAYVAASWLWNLATKKKARARLGQDAGVTIAHALNPHANTWARDVRSAVRDEIQPLDIAGCNLLCNVAGTLLYCSELTE